MGDSNGYRAVCRLCKTVLVSSLPHGRFDDFDAAARVARAHLLHSCDHAQGDIKGRELDAIADTSVEPIEGAA